MKVPGFRPRFKFRTDLAPDEIAQRIGQRLREDNPRGLWLKDAHYHIVLSYPERTAEAWTPQMDINFEELPDKRTLVRCLIGPGPGIWMLFAGGYVGLALLGLTGATLGIAQLMMHKSAWGFYALVLVVPLIAFMIYMELTGRERAVGDMRYLKEFVDRSLGCDCLKLAEEQGM